MSEPNKDVLKSHAIALARQLDEDECEYAEVRISDEDGEPMVWLCVARGVNLPAVESAWDLASSMMEGGDA